MQENSKTHDHATIYGQWNACGRPYADIAGTWSDFMLKKGTTFDSQRIAANRY